MTTSIVTSIEHEFVFVVKGGVATGLEFRLTRV